MKFILHNVLFTLIFFLLSTKVLAQIKIVASISPIASLAAMIFGDKADIETIAQSSGCPHHYHAKPSDLKKINEADLVIYIDEHFDGFITNLAKNYQGNIVKISKIDGLNLVKDGDDINWHFWLDLNNAELILRELAKQLTIQFPEYKLFIAKNLAESLYRISSLQQYKNAKLTYLSELIDLTQSLVYFFSGTNVMLIKPSYNQNSLKFYADLTNILEMKHDRCLIIDNDQNINSYNKFKAKLIQIDPEHWRTENMLSDDFIVNYTKIIDQLATCASY